jgi:hypothetical protein
MWWTERGDQVLRGAEWELFRTGLTDVWDWIEESIDEPGGLVTGVDAFDRLQPNQQLALLALVGEALRDEAEPGPDLTMNTEATVAAIFEHIAGQVQCEIDMSADPETDGEFTDWRELVLAAYREAVGDEEGSAKASPAGQPNGADEDSDDEDSDDEEPDDSVWSPPDVTSRDQSDWEFLILEYLADRILWGDGDFIMDDCFLDADPSWKMAMMEEMGIASDYYLAVAPDPTDGALEGIRRTLRTIGGRPEPPRAWTHPRPG